MPPATHAKRPRNNGNNNRTARIYRAQNRLLNALSEQVQVRELHQLATAGGNNNPLIQHYYNKKQEVNKKINRAIQMLKNAMRSKN